MCTFICGTLPTQQCQGSAELVCMQSCAAAATELLLAVSGFLCGLLHISCLCHCRYKQGRRSGVRHIVVMGAVDGTTLQGVS